MKFMKWRKKVQIHCKWGRRRDHKTKTEKESQDNAIKLHRELLNYKVIAGRGSAAGNVIRIQPPMCITKKNVLYVISALDCIANQQKQKH